MSFLNSTNSSCSSYSSFASLSSSTSELDVEQSFFSEKIFSVLSKPDGPVWKTGPSGFLRLVDFASSF
jgi:hypothetical protein